MHIALRGYVTFHCFNARARLSQLLFYIFIRYHLSIDALTVHVIIIFDSIFKLVTMNCQQAF